MARILILAAGLMLWNSTVFAGPKEFRDGLTISSDLVNTCERIYVLAYTNVPEFPENMLINLCGGISVAAFQLICNSIQLREYGTSIQFDDVGVRTTGRCESKRVVWPEVCTDHGTIHVPTIQCPPPQMSLKMGPNDRLCLYQFVINGEIIAFSCESEGKTVSPAVAYKNVNADEFKELTMYTKEYQQGKLVIVAHYDKEKMVIDDYAEEYSDYGKFTDEKPWIEQFF